MTRSTTNERVSSTTGPTDSNTLWYITRAAVIFTAGFVLGLFALAGRWDWYAGWAYLAVFYVVLITTNVYLWLTNPDVLRWRTQFGEGTKGWDKVCLAAFGVTFLLTLVVAALDGGRYQWAPMPAQLWPVGAALFIAGHGLVTWSMRVNPYFEKTARIQKDRDQKVITTGPYRYVRHPGYTGTIVGYALAPPIMLGSCWALLPALLATLSLIVRTALEDRMLQDELDGYAAYAARVRFRLVQYLW